MTSAGLWEQAANCEDSIKRFALLAMGTVSPLNTLVLRTKKPFNPMEYETFEFVTDKFRCLTEKVEHEPR
jgi:hypothetical protein